MNKFIASLGLFMILLLAMAFPILAQTEPTLPTELPTVLLSILSFLAPIVFQFLIKPISNATGRFLVVLGLSALTGFGAYLFAGYKIEFNVNFITYVFTFSQLAYWAVWKPFVFAKVAVLKSPGA